MADEISSETRIHLTRSDLVRNIGLYAERYFMDWGKMPDFAILNSRSHSILSHLGLLYPIDAVATSKKIKLRDAHYVVGVENEKESPRYIPVLGVDNLPTLDKRETRIRFSGFQLPLGFARNSFFGYKDISVYELNVTPNQPLQSRLMR